MRNFSLSVSLIPPINFLEGKWCLANICRICLICLVLALKKKLVVKPTRTTLRKDVEIKCVTFCTVITLWIKGEKEGDSMICGFWLVLFWLHSPYQVYQLVLPTPHPKYIPNPWPFLVLIGTPLVQAVSIFGLAHGHSCLPVLFASTQQTLFYTIGRKAVRNRSLIMLLVIKIHSCFPCLIMTERALYDLTLALTLTSRPTT